MEVPKQKEVILIDFSDNSQPIEQRLNQLAEVLVIDPRELIRKYNEFKNDWYGGNQTMRVVTGVFWKAFLYYIFPCLADIGKVWCAVMVCKSFYNEHRSGGREGKGGMEALVHYGKWYLMFMLIPWGVELVDQLGHKMYLELMKDGAKLG